MDGGKQTEANERGQLLRRAVGMAGKEWQANKSLQNSTAGRHSLLNKALQATQPADSPPGSGLKTHGPQLAGFAANNSCQMTSASRRAGKWGGVQRCWQP